MSLCLTTQTMEFSRQECWSGWPFLSPGDLPNSGLNPGLTHGGQIFYQLSQKGSPRILEWVAYPFSSGFSRHMNRTGVFCIASGFFNQLSYQGSPYSVKVGANSEARMWGSSCTPSPQIRWTCALTGQYIIREEPQTGHQEPSLSPVPPLTS